MIQFNSDIIQVKLKNSQKIKEKQGRKEFLFLRTFEFYDDYKLLYKQLQKINHSQADKPSCHRGHAASCSWWSFLNTVAQRVSAAHGAFKLKQLITHYNFGLFEGWSRGCLRTFQKVPDLYAYDRCIRSVRGTIVIQFYKSTSSFSLGQSSWIDA